MGQRVRVSNPSLCPNPLGSADLETGRTSTLKLILWVFGSSAGLDSLLDFLQ